jgi:hypothetical protein
MQLARGTFIDLDGEMIILDGACYQVSFDGKVSDVEGDRLIPYAVVMRFNAEFSEHHPKLINFSELAAACDQLRKPENLFYAFCIDGAFFWSRRSDIDDLKEPLFHYAIRHLLLHWSRLSLCIRAIGCGQHYRDRRQGLKGTSCHLFAPLSRLHRSVQRPPPRSSPGSRRQMLLP